MKLHNKQHKGFTLVELLVVIAIIAVLAALAMPAMFDKLKKAKIVKSQGVCQAFEVAVNNFESEYNYLPAATASPVEATDEATALRSDSNIMAVLAGVEDTYNPKKIKFFEQSEPKGADPNFKDGMHVSGSTAKLYDPWGEPYYLIIDYDYDGQVVNPYKAGEYVRKKAICWSTGPDFNETDQSTRDNPSNFD